MAHQFKQGELIQDKPTGGNYKGRVIACVSIDGNDYYEIFWLNLGPSHPAQLKPKPAEVIETFYERAFA